MSLAVNLENSIKTEVSYLLVQSNYDSGIFHSEHPESVTEPTRES